MGDAQQHLHGGAPFVACHETTDRPSPGRRRRLIAPKHVLDVPSQDASQGQIPGSVNVHPSKVFVVDAIEVAPCSDAKKR